MKRKMLGYILLWLAVEAAALFCVAVLSVSSDTQIQQGFNNAYVLRAFFLIGTIVMLVLSLVSVFVAPVLLAYKLLHVYKTTPSTAHTRLRLRKINIARSRRDRRNVQLFEESIQQELAQLFETHGVIDPDEPPPADA